MRQKALTVALSRKMKDGEMLFVDTLSLTAPKTKEAHTILSSLATVDGFKKLGGKRKNTALLLLPEMNKETLRAFRNLPAVTVGELKKLNVLDTLSYRYLLVLNPETSMKILEKTDKK